MSVRDDRALWNEAAAWYARMQEPGSEQEVEDFEAWLACDPAHAGAYAEMEALSGAVAAIAPQFSERPKAPRWSPWRPALASVVLLAIMATLVVAWGGFSEPAYARLANTGSAVRGVRLADGTGVWLDPGAELGVRIDEERREIVLRRGRVRIDPASGVPPLRARSGELTVTQATTRFDMAIDNDGVVLGALDGAIAIVYHDGRTRSLSVGQAIAIDASGERPAVLDRTWPGARVRFADASLGRIAAVSNQQPGPDIAFGDPSVGDLTVTGVLDLRDTRRLARKLAAAHGLQVVDDGRTLTLKR